MKRYITILWLALGMNVAATAQETFTEGDFNYGVLADGTLAGSVLTMPKALSNLIHRYGADPAAACAMCTSTPAESVGEHLAGHMTAGAPAILTRWSPDWQMKSVITENGESCQFTGRMV